MIPPWTKHPSLDPLRYGDLTVEDERVVHLIDFRLWYARLSDAEADLYRRENPRPDAWDGIYEFLEWRRTGQRGPMPDRSAKE